MSLKGRFFWGWVCFKFEININYYQLKKQTFNQVEESKWVKRVEKSNKFAQEL